MRTILITILFLCLFGICHAQKTEANDTTIYDYVDQEPVPIGGLPKFYRYLMQNIRVVDSPSNNIQTQTTLLMEFVIEKNGSLSHIRILKDTSPSAAKSAIKTLSESSRWMPGRLQGRLVGVRYKIKSIIEFQ